MKILLISDEESNLILDYYRENKLDDVELILSVGDLSYAYLQNIKRNIKAPLYYVKGNHDEFKSKSFDSELVEWRCFEYKGIRIAGIGCKKYNKIISEEKMSKSLKKLYKRIEKNGGVDIVISHYPARNCGDGKDETHRGYQVIREFVEKVNPKYFIYGHNHLNYGRNDRVMYFNGTTLINAYEKYVLDYKWGFLSLT